MKLKLQSRLLRNTGWMFMGQGLGVCLRAAYFIVIARLLGVVQYGVVVGAFALVNMVAEHSRLGAGTVLLRYVSPDRRRFSIYWGNLLLVTSVMSFVLILAVRVIGRHFLDPASAAIVPITAVASCFFEQITIASTQGFQAFQTMRPAALLNQLTALLRTAVAVVMLATMHHATAWQWSLASLAVSAVATVAALIMVSTQLGWPRPRPSLAIRHIGEGFEYSLSASATVTYNDLDKTMLSHYGMGAQDGIYGMAYRIIEMGFTPIAAMLLASSPRLFEMAAEDPQAPVHLGNRLLRHGLLASAAAAAGMFACAPLIPHIVGRSFAEGIEALRWICLIPVFRTVHGTTGSVLTAIGRQHYRTCTQLVAVALNFGLNIWLIPSFGWHGAAWSSLATDGSLALLNWFGLQWIARSLPAARKEKTPIPVEVTCTSILSSQPLVSIIIPYYNHASYLAETVASVRSQGYTRVEIIVVDDGSPVPAQDLLDADPAMPADLRILRIPNQGAAAARNHGFAHSSGEFLVFLDSDDHLRAGSLEAHLTQLLQCPDTAMTFGSVLLIDAEGRELAAPKLCRPRSDYFPMLLESNPIGCPGSTMIRRSAFLEAGPFDASLRNAEDYDLYLKIARRYPVRQIAACVADYRQHNGGKSGDKTRMLAAVMTILERLEQRESLTQAERRRLAHGRRRWLHQFNPRSTVSYRLRGLYYSFRAMLAVSPRHYLRPGQET